MKKTVYLFLALLALLISCNDAPEINPEVRLHISNDDASLSRRVNMVNQGINLVNNSQGGTRGEVANASASFVSPEFELVAEIESPNINGEVLSATHVAIEGNYAYVSYHISEDPYGGGFDVIDLSNQSNIRITSQALYTDSDFNALTVDNEETLSEGIQRVYLAGANGQGALVEKIDIENGIIIANNDSLPLQGFNANGIVRTKHMLYVTVGGRDGTGGLRAVDMRSGPKFFTLSEEENFSDAKDVAVAGPDINDHMVVLRGGSSAGIYAYEVDANGIDAKRRYNIDPIDILDGKNTLLIDGSYVYTALSDQGMKIFDLDDLDDDPEFHITSEEMGGGLTNAVAVDQNHVYIANGLTGLYIGDKPNGDDFNITGSLNLEGSANYVVAKNDYILVANGIGGTKILKRKASEASLNANNLDNIYQSFQKIDIQRGTRRTPIYYEGGKFSSKDADELMDPEEDLKNQMQIPIDELLELNEIQFDLKADKEYKVYVYLAAEEGQYTEKIGEFEVEKNKNYVTKSITGIEKTGFKYVVISAIPEEKGKGQATLQDIIIKGLK